MQFLYSFSCPISLLPRHAQFLFQMLLFSKVFSCSWECSVRHRRGISVFLPRRERTHNAPSSSFPCIERSVSLNPSHALQFPFIPLSIPRTALYVAVLVLLHLFFSSPLRLTVSAINSGVRPPHVILHAVRLAERFVSTAHKHAVGLSLSPRIHVEEVWQVPWLIRSSAKRGDDTHGEFNKYGV